MSEEDEREQAERRYMVELGLRIRAERILRSMTQKDAAQAAGIATDMISRIENGRYQSPGLRTLLRIADGFGMPVSKLLPDGSNDPPRAESQNARLVALTHRAEPRDLDLIVEIASAIVNRK
ncbi:helix-turn-helix transcriptional regulator [Pseudenhygromyxa sp. WMMC2535]|uniref:helix-turn-helix domain-containing protein n=1 Tax=Pseudenhygromyxa sp. WMMC2535 TaxID=2712867 RepID=UPI0015575AED|nr:helix-turn-helix transcriptional regulator [Pseudenhygromyxa sp. WMMC2535]NVB38781.1 helix-turn-helix transcriptional regulator [Pseudenhygromyxa sp. WMMC2535]